MTMLDPNRVRLQPDPEYVERVNAATRLSYNRRIGVFEYLRDTHHAQTVGDAEEALRQHKVDPDVVRIWIEADLIHTPILENPIVESYPELDEDIKRLREKRIADIHRAVWGEEDPK